MGIEAKKQLKLQKINEAAKIIRDEINSNAKWTFQGDFDDHADPPMLFYFLRLVLFGKKNVGLSDSPEHKKIYISVMATCNSSILY